MYSTVYRVCYTYYFSDEILYGATGLSTIVPKPTLNLDVMLRISLSGKSSKLICTI